MVASSDDLNVSDQRLNSLQMAKEEYFSQFKARWDIVVVNGYCYTTVKLSMIHQININIQNRIWFKLGINLVQQLHPQSNHYVDDEWLYDKLTDVFLPNRMVVEIKDRYDTVIKMDKSNSAQKEDEGLYKLG
jgi:hypothetical protein